MEIGKSKCVGFPARLVGKQSAAGLCRALDYVGQTTSLFVAFAYMINLSRLDPAHTQYEGTSHDVDENKGAKKSMLEHPTICMKKRHLFLLSHDVYENKQIESLVGKHVTIRSIR